MPERIIAPEPKREPLRPVDDDWAYPFGEAGVGDQYYVVLNMFSTVYRAETARQMAEEATNTPYKIHYDSAQNLFKVFSSLISEEQEVERLLNVARSNGFTVASVSHGPPPGPRPMEFKIHLAAFPTEAQAVEMLEANKELVDFPISVEYDELTRRYAVRSQVFSTLPEARQTLTAARKIAAFRMAFLISYPRIPAVPIIHTSML